jgi:hypothetical protein
MNPAARDPRGRLRRPRRRLFAPVASALALAVLLSAALATDTLDDEIIAAIADRAPEAPFRAAEGAPAPAALAPAPPRAGSGTADAAASREALVAAADVLLA